MKHAYECSQVIPNYVLLEYVDIERIKSTFIRSIFEQLKNAMCWILGASPVVQLSSCPHRPPISNQQWVWSILVKFPRRHCVPYGTGRWCNEQEDTDQSPALNVPAYTLGVHSPLGVGSFTFLHSIKNKVFKKSYTLWIENGYCMCV